MRWFCLICAIGLSMTADLALSQDESLCNPCVDYPSGIRRDAFKPAIRRQVVTAEDMRRLGVVSVADMINQLPGSIEAPDASAEPVSPEGTDAPTGPDTRTVTGPSAPADTASGEAETPAEDSAPVDPPALPD